MAQAARSSGGKVYVQVSELSKNKLTPNNIDLPSHLVDSFVLTTDIENAFLKSMGRGAEDDKGNVPELAKDLSKAIVDFLKKQTFNITELKAPLQVEQIQTNYGLQGDVLSSVTVTTSGGPGNVSIGKRGVAIPALDLNKDSGQGGKLYAVGHAYIGNKPVPNADTNEEYVPIGSTFRLANSSGDFVTYTVLSWSGQTVTFSPASFSLNISFM